MISKHRKQAEWTYRRREKMGKTNDVLFSKFHFYIAAQMDKMVIYVLVIGRKKADVQHFLNLADPSKM